MIVNLLEFSAKRFHTLIKMLPARVHGYYRIGFSLPKPLYVAFKQLTDGKYVIAGMEYLAPSYYSLAMEYPTVIDIDDNDWHFDEIMVRFTADRGITIGKNDNENQWQFEWTELVYINRLDGDEYRMDYHWKVEKPIRIEGVENPYNDIL